MDVPFVPLQMLFPCLQLLRLQPPTLASLPEKLTLLLPEIVAFSVLLLLYNICFYENTYITYYLLSFGLFR